jgi:hypothetical protein
MKTIIQQALVTMVALWAYNRFGPGGASVPANSNSGKSGAGTGNVTYL